MESLPLVMEPESRMYTSPVLVLDFQSLYPSQVMDVTVCSLPCVCLCLCVFVFVCVFVFAACCLAGKRGLGFPANVRLFSGYLAMSD